MPLMVAQLVIIALSLVSLGFVWRLHQEPMSASVAVPRIPDPVDFDFEPTHDTAGLT